MIDVEKILVEMTLKEKIAQMYLQYYQGYDDLPQNLRELNRKNLLGGLIFFSGNNVRDIDQLHDMTKKIQSYAKENKYNLPFLLTIDQEGGQLTAIFNGTTIFPGNMSMGFANDENLAYLQGKHVGRELKYAGINICYAPVLDVDYDVKNGSYVVDNRRFSTDPEVVANMGSAFIRGLEDEGILACGKHFPGMRITKVDTHFQVDRNPYDKKRLENVEILPFKKAIEKGVSCIMTHHGIFEALDKDYPASLSKKILTYLRKDLGFEGLIVSDDLIMKAILNEYGEKESIKLAINAGVDLIISTCAGNWFIDYVYGCVIRGEIEQLRIDESVRRILNYKNKSDAGNIPDQKTFDSTYGQELSAKIASKGLILYKGDEDELAIKMEEKDKLGIIFANPARLVMSDATNLYDISFKDIIMSKGYHKNIKEAIMPWHPTDEEIISLADVGIISEVLIFTTVNAYNFQRQIEVLKEFRKSCPTKKVISIATRSPMDAKILAEYSDYVIITGGLTPSILEGVANVIFGKEKIEFNKAKEFFCK
ncbi:beta-glucosidase [Vallitalea longa]|uniref:beta-N-acetylhexosaminidase n=1 Tax=Vallitalea longa TaxID=2936439 RepID=A0A9W5Y7H6_9FIRM|nr:glycoside hydrolase family 3 N-terminal domain-containing protein [Vallitalea longa]GKX28237.1 beta-glucosidase [Vallitalea longa]